MPKIDLLDMDNPYPIYKKLRRESPIFFDKNSGYWIISKYEFVKQILLDEESFSAEIERINYKDLSEEAKKILDPISFVELYGLSSTENPSHDKVKKVLMPIFNRLFETIIKPLISIVINQNIEKLRYLNRFDIMKDLFYDLPTEIILKILGIPESEMLNVKNWSESRMQLTWGDGSEQVLHAKNIVKYWNYCVNLIEDRKLNPQDDLPSYLLDAHFNDPNSISIHEITLLCYGLVFSGHMTTTTFLTETVRILLESGKWENLIKSDIPIKDSTNEMLRMCPSAFTRRRLTKRHVAVGGIEIPRNEKLLLSIGSANRDEEIFKTPDIIDFKRRNSNQHLTFGRGFHYCIGARLVHLEYEIVVEKLSKTFPFLRLSDENNYIYHRNISIRAIKELIVERKYQ